MKRQTPQDAISDFNDSQDTMASDDSEDVDVAEGDSENEHDIWERADSTGGQFPPSNVPPDDVLKGIDLDRLIFVKLFAGWSKSDVRAHMLLEKHRLSWKLLYRRISELAEWAAVGNFPPNDGINGGFVGGGNPEGILRQLIDMYTEQHLWSLDPSMDALIVYIYMDGRRVWGKNELLAFGFKQCVHFQSPANVYPLAMAKWTG